MTTEAASLVIAKHDARITEEIETRHAKARGSIAVFALRLKLADLFAAARSTIGPTSGPASVLNRAAEEIVNCAAGETNPRVRRALFHAAERVLCIDPATDRTHWCGDGGAKDDEEGDEI